jgi:histidine ammonia-lyase
MKDEFPNGPFVINGENLTPVALVALARGGPRTIALTESAWERVAVGRAIVDAAIAGREVHYGINTGVGSEKGRRVDPAEFATFNRRIIIGEATNMPGSNFEAGIVRGALVVLANNAATGRLGVRPALVERLLALFAAPALPLVRSGTSGGMADLSPLAQLSLAVIGEDRPHSIESPAERFDLAAKEAVSLINCNAFLLSHAAIVLETSTQLAEAFDLATAFSLEGFRGNLNYLRKGFGPNLGNPWQIKSASRIADALDGSALWSPAEWRNLHDPLSFRCAQRVNGALIPTCADQHS